MNKGIAIQILTYAIPIIAVLYILRLVFKRTGLIKSFGEKKEDKKTKDKAKRIVTTDVLRPDFYKGKSFKPMSDSLIKKYAEQLGDAIRWWGTNEALVFSTFKSLNNKYNVSQVSEKYYEIYKEDLRAAIVNDLSNKDLAMVDSIIESLPNR